MNFLTVKVGGDGQSMLTGEGFQIPVEERVLSDAGASRGQEVIMGVRPEDLKDVRFPGRDGLPKINSKVEVVESMGSEIFVYLNIGGKTLTSRMDPRSSDIKPGHNLQVAIDSHHLHLFDAKRAKALLTPAAPPPNAP